MDNALDERVEIHRDYTGAKMGMWIFLFTEIVLFGGLFLLYAVYRFKYPGEFHTAANELDSTLGAINTMILLTSSLTMALSISAIQKGKVKLSILLQASTLLFGIAFMVNKYIEWGAKIHHGLYPNSETLLALNKGEILFYGLYYVMTGLHGLHVLIGIGVFLFTISFTMSGTISSDNYIKLENSGLYWHFVDIVWVYLFPLFYLIT